MNIKNAIFWVGTLLIVLFCIFVNYTNLIEAYGDGPPYFNRTTNMDKWQSPILFLVIVNSIALIAIFSIHRLTRSANNSGTL